MNKTALAHAHQREDATGSVLSGLQTEILTVLQAAGGRPLRARQVLDRLPGRGPAARKAVAAALGHLHAAGLASREPGEGGVWLYTAPACCLPAGPPSLGSLLGLRPLETAIMQVAWNAPGWLTITQILTELGYPATRHSPVARTAGRLCSKDLLQRTRAQPGHPARPGGSPPLWVYCPAQTFSQYTGGLIAALLDHSPDPAGTLAHALATTPAGPRAGIDVQAPHRDGHTRGLPP